MKFIKTIQKVMFVNTLAAILIGHSLVAQEEVTATGLLEAQWNTDEFIRGAKVNDDSFTGTFELSNIADLPITGSSVYVAGSISDGDLGNSVKDVFIGAVTEWKGIDFDTGVRYLDTGTINRELYVGAGLDMLLSPRVYVFRDVANDDTYVEGKVSYEYETDILTKVNHAARVSAGTQLGDESREYYTGSYTVSKEIGPGVLFVTGTVVVNTGSSHDNDTGVSIGYTYTF